MGSKFQHVSLVSFRFSTPFQCAHPRQARLAIETDNPAWLEACAQLKRRPEVVVPIVDRPVDEAKKIDDIQCYFDLICRSGYLRVDKGNGSTSFFDPPCSISLTSPTFLEELARAFIPNVIFLKEMERPGKYQLEIGEDKVVLDHDSLTLFLHVLIKMKGEEDQRIPESHLVENV